MDCCFAYLTPMMLHRVGDATLKRNDRLTRKDHKKTDEFNFETDQSDLLRFYTLDCPRPEIGNRFDRGHSAQAYFDTYVHKIGLLFCEMTVYMCVSCRVVSCRVVSCRAVSCRVVSCRVVVFRFVSFRFVCLFVCLFVVVVVVVVVVVEATATRTSTFF